LTLPLTFAAAAIALPRAASLTVATFAGLAGSGTARRLAFTASTPASPTAALTGDHGLLVSDPPIENAQGLIELIINLRSAFAGSHRAAAT
jgi:hypothetical protein